MSLPGQETASLAGTVTAADRLGEPLRGAVVFLRFPDSLIQISATTDEAGRFLFSSLRPGRYVLSAMKPAYVTMAYGARQPGRPGTAVSLAPGQHLDGIHMALARGAVLSGVVRDMTGAPMTNGNWLPGLTCTDAPILA